MAVKGTDGKTYHSFGRANAHGAMPKEGGAAKSAVKPMAKMGAATPEKIDGSKMMNEGKGGPNDVSSMPIHQVVEEHGPAEDVHIHHDHEEGQHHVHSVHGEKHHHSDHESVDEAHDHAQQASGMSDGAEEESPDNEEESEMMSSKKGGGIPGMSED